jgi:hypothetical protein
LPLHKSPPLFGRCDGDEAAVHRDASCPRCSKPTGRDMTSRLNN